jgi:hypothetical protein
MITARIAVATALKRAISSSGVRALNGCLITVASYARNQTCSWTVAFACGSDGISFETWLIAAITEPVAV